jgi:hypothetical protein
MNLSPLCRASSFEARIQQYSSSGTYRPVSELGGPSGSLIVGYGTGTCDRGLI